MAKMHSVLFALAEVAMSAAIACDPHASIKGAKVWLPGESGFNEKRLDQYAKYLGLKEDANAGLHPALLVSCFDEQQVQSALAFARQCGYSVVIRGGGHSYIGLSSCSRSNCMQLDVSGINHVSVDDNLLTAGPGIRLINFNSFMRRHNLSVPHGVCTGVGLGGHLQSSSYGPLSHAYGSGLDHVESFRMVLANGSLIKVSRYDSDSTLYKSIIGSSPGSWGVITEYTVRGIRDADVPSTHMIRAQYNFSRAKFVAVLSHIQFIARDQEDRNLRDMRVILFAAPPSQGEDTNMYIRIHGLWTGVDSGEMTQEWKKLYLQPLLDLNPDEYSDRENTPLSRSTILTPWDNHGDRYAIQDFISDHWWSQQFIEMIADEMLERVQMMPNVYPSFQFNPLGTNSQWTRNAGMNSLTWRVFRAYADDWIFVKNESLYGDAVKRMRDFRDRTRSFWQFQDGGERSTFMTPQPNATDLRNSTIARQFFPNVTQFLQLQTLKAQLDPEDLFSNKNTIPLPADVHSSNHLSVVVDDQVNTTKYDYCRLVPSTYIRPRFVDGDLEFCATACSMDPVCAAFLHANRICALYDDVTAVVQAPAESADGQCAIKTPVAGCFFRFTKPWMLLASQLVLLTFFFFASSTALLAIPWLRHDWRRVNLAVLPLSCFGGFCWFFFPDTDLVLLLLLWPCKAFADPRLDFASISRGLRVSSCWKIVLGTLYALLHHAGLCMLIIWTRDVARSRPRGAIETHPWPLLIVAIVEMIIWLVGAFIMVREAHKFCRFVLPGGLAIQIGCVVGMRLATGDGSRDVLFGTLVLGNFLGVIANLVHVPISTYEEFEKDEHYSPHRSIARCVHEEHLRRANSQSTLITEQA